MSERRKVLKQFELKHDYMDSRIKSGIEENRKGMGAIRLTGADGKPVTQAHIRVIQKNHEFKYGANLFMLDEFNQPEQNAEYKKRFAETFNIATLPFYWDTLEPEQGHPRFAKDSPKIYRRPAPDLCIEFCRQHNIEPKAHCLNYEGFTPPWALSGDVRREKRLLAKRFQELAERYSQSIPSWEVTNETYWPIDHGHLNFYNDPEFVEWSFKTAENFFPGNELIINEWGGVWSSREFHMNRSAYYMQIERALLKGARIDTIGMQFHMFFPSEAEQQETASYYDPEHLYRVMDTYAKLGRPLQVTELTIPAYAYTDEDEAMQAEILRNLYSIWFSHAAMKGIIYWNLVDGFAAFAPQGDMKAGENYFHGGLLRYDFTPKPAYHVLHDLFHKTWHTELELSADGAEDLFFRGFYGDYELEITAGEQTCTRTIHLGKGLINHFNIQL